MNPDIFLIVGALGVCLGAAVLVFFLVDRAVENRRRPYLAARWDDARGDWVNETPHDVGPDPLLLLDDITAHLKAYGAEIADLYEPATTDHQGDQT